MRPVYAELMCRHGTISQHLIKLLWYSKQEVLKNAIAVLQRAMVYSRSPLKPAEKRRRQLGRDVIGLCWFVAYGKRPGQGLLFNYQILLWGGKRLLVARALDL